MTKSVTAGELREMLKDVPCGTEIYLFCGPSFGPLSMVSVNRRNTAYESQCDPTKQILTEESPLYLSLSAVNQSDGDNNSDGEGGTGSDGEGGGGEKFGLKSHGKGYAKQAGLN